jgi:hypothetical protein
VNPWLTSNDLVASVKRKISFPVSQNTFSDSDILAFANEEMMISQVPSILQWHEEYLVASVTVPLIPFKDRYSVPDRAIGMRLRDIAWSDLGGNLFEMTRITADDKAYYQRSSGSNQQLHKFYLEGNDVVLSPNPSGAVTGSLVFYIFLRPNLLVANERASTIASFSKSITINNALIAVNDTVVINDVVFTAVSGAPAANQFQIGGSSIITATNLAAAITLNGLATASSGSPSSAVCTLTYTDISYDFFTVSTGISISTQTVLNVDSVPSNITAGSYIDLLQTKPGHKMLKYDILVPTAGVSSTSISINDSDVPSTMIVGDYVCSQNECIIPQIPTDLHNELAERTCARILAAIGDQAGLAITKGNIQEMEQHQATLLDARVDGAPKKITGRHSMLRYSKMGTKRRL